MDPKLEALRKANEARYWRAEQRARVKGGDWEHAIALLLSGDDRLASMPVILFLTWLPNIGEARAEKMIGRAAGDWARPRSMGDLTMRTATALADQVRRARPKSPVSERVLV